MESKFLKHGYQQSRNTTGDRYNIKPAREKLRVRPLGKPELTGTMGIKICQSHQIAMMQIVMHDPNLHHK